MGGVLDQSEVDALLKGVVKGEVETESKVPSREEEEGIRPFDLLSQSKIIRGRMPTLDVLNERFAKAFRISLSSILHKTVDVSVSSTEFTKFGEFIKSLPVPTSLNIFKMDPLRGFSMMVVESKLVFAMIDYLFGGTGEKHVKVEGRDFTAIEQHIIHKVVKAGLANLQMSWKPVYEVDIQFVRSEVNPQFAAIVSDSEMIVLVTFEVEVEKSSGKVNLCLPYPTIEPIRGKLQSGFQSDTLGADDQWVKRLREEVDCVPVNITVEMGRAAIMMKDLMKLKTGDIMQLDTDMDKGSLVKVEGVPKFRGTPGIHKGSYGVKIKELFRARE